MTKGILLDDNFDLQVENAQLVVGETTYQNQKLLLLCDKGEIKEYPTIGVGIYRYLEGYSSEALAREIRSEFSRDGMKISKISVNIPNLDIEAEYGK